MVRMSKRLKELNASVDRDKVYNIGEAVSLLKSISKVKFDETVDVAINLGIDSQKSDQLVRGVIQLPKGIGKTVRVAVFASGEKAKEAQDAGADVVGSDDLVEQIQKGEINFDKCIATPDMMVLLGKVAKILGPKGLMPNAKLGSVTLNVKDAVNSAKAGQVEFRNERSGIVHCGVGKISFSEEDLVYNIRSLFDAISKAKPAAAKGIYFKKAYISSTMGVSLRVDVGSIVKAI